MKHAAALLVILLFSLGLSVQASPSQPPELVDTGWLVENLAQPGLVLLDIQEQEAFVRHHLPGSVNIPYSRWRSNERSAVPGNLLDLKAYQQMLGNAGIGSDDHVVIVATGLQPGDLSASARVFWTLRLLGHQRLSLLNGGLADYAGKRLGPLQRGGSEPRAPRQYQGMPNLTILARADDLTGAEVLVDARSPGEHLGLIRGSERERPGTIPGAVNLPFSWLTEDASSGKLREPQALSKLLQKSGVPKQDGAVHFCHTGNRAALTWFVDYALMGNRAASLYDSSMLEWAADPKRDIELKWEL